MNAVLATSLIALAAVGAVALRPSPPGAAGALDVRVALRPAASRALALEHSAAAADLVWLQVVQRVGGDRLGPQGWNSVEDLTELATDLDPLYFVVYESVTTLMTVTAKRGMSADRIALKGLAAMPGAWRLYFLIAYGAFFVDDEPYFASRWMSMAAECDGAPHYLASLAARMLYQGGASTSALAILDQMELMAPNERVADQLSERRRLILTEERFVRFDQLCRLFKVRYGFAPSSPAQALGLWFTMDEPADFMGAAAYYDASCVTRSSMYPTRDAENLELTRKHREAMGGGRP